MNRGTYTMIPALCLAASLLITACHTKAADPSDPGITATATAETEESARRPVPPSAKQEQDLKDKLLSESGGELVQFICQDFENSGTYQAFAVVGERTKETNSDIYNGTVWFVSDKQVQKIGEENFYTALIPRPIGSQTLVTMDRFFGTGTISYIYGIKDDSYYEDPISGQITGLRQQEDGTFTAVQDVYDASVDGTGHTWKTYWFYWKDGFHEFGGLEIPLADLQKLDGFEQVQQQLDQSKGKIVSALYRGNQIININYQTPWQRDGEYDYINNNFINLKYDNGKITVLPADDNRGVYQEALLPSIAEYPDRFPVKS